MSNIFFGCGVLEDTPPQTILLNIRWALKGTIDDSLVISLSEERLKCGFDSHQSQFQKHNHPQML